LTLTNKTIIIGIIYRPPNGNLHKFVDYLNEELDLLDKTNKSIYLMGDFNSLTHNVPICALRLASG
jgi:exonuclease III